MKFYFFNSLEKNLLIALTLLAANFVNAQESSPKKCNEVIFSIGPAANRIINSNVDNDVYKKEFNQTRANINFNYIKYFNNVHSIRVGIEYISYKKTVYQNGLFEKSDQHDIDNNKYTLWINSNLTDSINLKYLNFPIMLHTIIGKSKQFYKFIDVGIVNGLLLGGKYIQKGSIENMGNYSTDNQYFDIVSQGNPYYNYRKVHYDKESTDEYKTYNLSARISIGIVTFISNQTSLRVSAEYTKGISDITGEKNIGKDYSNIFGDQQEYQKTKTNSLVLTIGVIFDIKNNNSK